MLIQQRTLFHGIKDSWYNLKCSNTVVIIVHAKSACEYCTNLSLTFAPNSCSSTNNNDTLPLGEAHVVETKSR